MSETTGELLDRFRAGDDREGLRRDAAELLVGSFAGYPYGSGSAPDGLRIRRKHLPNPANAGSAQVISRHDSDLTGSEGHAWRDETHNP